MIRKKKPHPQPLSKREGSNYTRRIEFSHKDYSLKSVCSVLSVCNTLKQSIV